MIHLQIPQGGTHREWSPSPEPFSISFRTPRKGFPKRAPAERDAPTPEPSNYLLKFPVNGLPHRFPNGPLRREIPISRVCSLVIHFSLKVPGKRAPPPCSQQGPYGERCFVSRAHGLFIHLYLSESPINESSHEKCGKHTVTVHGAPRGQKVYIQWSAAWFSKGIMYYTAVTTPVPYSLQRDTFHLGLGRPLPR
jgi:hypothetical protein